MQDKIQKEKVETARLWTALYAPAVLSKAAQPVA